MNPARIFIFVVFSMFMCTSARAAFKHPGILHTSEDLQRMKQMVAKGAEPS